MSAWPALTASRLTVDQKTQAHQSERIPAFHRRTYTEMYSCSVCMFPQTIFMWEMSFCLASKISSRSTCLSGKAWVSHHNLLAKWSHHIDAVASYRSNMQHPFCMDTGHMARSLCAFASLRSNSGASFVVFLSLLRSMKCD